MNFKEYLIESTRHDFIIKITNLSYQAYLHMIKLLYFYDPINRHKYIREIVIHLNNTKLIVAKTDFDPSYLKQLLMSSLVRKRNGSPVLTPYNIPQLLNSALSGYKLQKVRTIKELTEILSDVYDYIVERMMSNSAFDVDEFTNYIDQYIIDEVPN